MTIRILFQAAFLLVSLSATVLADPDPLAKPTSKEAADHLTQGNRYYRLRDFDKAIEEFKAGALVEDAPVFLYNLGQSYRQLARYEDAIWHYERFVARAHPTGQLKEAIDGFLVTMRDELAKAASHREPTEPAPDTSPPMGDATQPANAQPLAQPLPIADKKPGGILTGRRKVALMVGGAGLIALGGGVAFGLRAKGYEDDANDLCSTDACDRADEANALLDKGQSNALYANIAYGVGAAALIGATVLWFTGAPDESAAGVAPRLSTSGAGLDFWVRF